MKIALVLVGNSNLGNNLTNYALYSLVRKMCSDAEVVAINVPKVFYSDYYGCDLFCLFKNKIDIKTVNVYKYDELEKLGTKYDLYICGSDQIWRLGFAILTNMYPYMDWVDQEKKKISYSTSFGIENYEGNLCESWLASKFLERFDHLSVRESSGKEIINSTFMLDKEVECVLDPVLLLDDRVIDEFVKFSDYPVVSNYVAAYLWEKDNVQVVKRIKNALNLDNSMIMDVKVMADFKFYFNSAELGVEDWLKIINNSEIFLTDSFHGVCAAIMLKKDFYFIYTDNPRGFIRIYDLLNKLDLVDRIIKKDSDVSRKNVNYEIVNKKLAVLQQSSIDWLKHSIYDNKDHKEKDELFLSLYKERVYAQNSNIQRFKSLSEWLKEKFDSSSEIVVFGVGNVFFRNYKEVKHQLGVTKIFDNDRDKWGRNFYGLTCYNPEEINSSNIVLILVEQIKSNYEIKMQLLEMGITTVLSYDFITSFTGKL